MKLPATLALSAFIGESVGVSGAIAATGNRWGGRGEPLRRQAPLAPDAQVNLADWSHPDVGWGLVLPDRDDLSAQDKARGIDAPEPIHQLLAARPEAPVLRFRTDLGTRKLARYFADGGRQDPEIGLRPFGVGKGRLPLYLLIVGSPTEIPWQLQYSLNRRHHVGRLDLPAEGLANYVTALVTDWKGLESDPAKPLVWSVSFDTMTQKMHATVALQIHDALTKDDEIGSSTGWLQADAATHAGLIDALKTTRPSLIVTSSHGKTGPLDDQATMRATLGLPVDVNRDTLDPDALLRDWSPSGAVWYAQACCSAGSNDGTSYESLLDGDSLAAKVVRGVAELGPSVAPLPSRLLAARKPLRAFVGHVEPTFDWTLIMPDTGQYLTAPLVGSMYPELYRRRPRGRALVW
jgi:hypothetical protein